MNASAWNNFQYYFNNGISESQGSLDWWRVAYAGKFNNNWVNQRLAEEAAPEFEPNPNGENMPGEDLHILSDWRLDREFGLAPEEIDWLNENPYTATYHEQEEYWYGWGDWFEDFEEEWVE